MPPPEQPSPDFEHPPTVETVLGVQFDALRGFRSNHYGWFWHEHLADRGFRDVSDENVLPTYQEPFGDLRLQLTRKIVGPDRWAVRMKARREKSRTVQLQPDKLYYSWNRLDSNAPRYAAVRGEFLDLVDELRRFAEKGGIGPVKPNLWEVQYVNQIPPGPLWQEPREWHRVLPTLFPPGDPAATGTRFATYSGEWHFEIEPSQGRVHVKVAKMVMNQAEAPTLFLSLTARGEIGGGTPDIETGIDLGHAACVRVFLQLTSIDAHNYWKLKS